MPLEIPAAHLFEHEYPDGGRQIVVLAALLYFGDETRNRDAFALRNLLQHIPERIFQTDTGFMPIDDDGVLRHP